MNAQLPEQVRGLLHLNHERINCDLSERMLFGQCVTSNAYELSDWNICIKTSKDLKKEADIKCTLHAEHS